MTMKNKILAMGNRGDYSFFIFRKEQGLLQMFRKILLELGELEDNVNELVYGVYDIEASGKPPKEISISSLKDQRCNFYRRDYYNIDLIFAEARVFLLGTMNEESREKAMKIIKKECELVKYQKHSAWPLSAISNKRAKIGRTVVLGQ